MVKKLSKGGAVDVLVTEKVDFFKKLFEKGLILFEYLFSLDQNLNLVLYDSYELYDFGAWDRLNSVGFLEILCAGFKICAKSMIIKLNLPFCRYFR